MKAILPVMLSGEAEKEYWNLFRGNQEKFRESKGGNRGRFVLLYFVLIASSFRLCSEAELTIISFSCLQGRQTPKGGLETWPLKG